MASAASSSLLSTRPLELSGAYRVTLVGTRAGSYAVTPEKYEEGNIVLNDDGLHFVPRDIFSKYTVYVPRDRIELCEFEGVEYDDRGRSGVSGHYVVVYAISTRLDLRSSATGRLRQMVEVGPRMHVIGPCPRSLQQLSPINAEMVNQFVIRVQDVLGEPLFDDLCTLLERRYDFFSVKSRRALENPRNARDIRVPEERLEMRDMWLAFRSSLQRMSRSRRLRSRWQQVKEEVEKRESASRSESPQRNGGTSDTSNSTPRSSVSLSRSPPPRTRQRWAIAREKAESREASGAQSPSDAHPLAQHVVNAPGRRPAAPPPPLAATAGSSASSSFVMLTDDAPSPANRSVGSPLPRQSPVAGHFMLSPEEEAAEKMITPTAAAAAAVPRMDSIRSTVPEPEMPQDRQPLSPHAQDRARRPQPVPTVTR